MPAMNCLPAYRAAAVALCLTALAGCAQMPPADLPAAPAVSPQQRWAAVQEAGRTADTELDVQPLRDPQVQDLRELAELALDRGDLESAVQALNQALEIVADDPAVLQERAELALLQAQYERAETLARRAYDVGSRSGPLCRRHWSTIEQSRLARSQAENAASAQAQLQNCTIPGVTRY